MGYRKNIPKDEYLAGLGAATNKLQDFVDNLVSASAQGLADTALYILGESVERAPVDTGDLRGSGYVKLDGQPYASGSSSGTAIIKGSVPEEATRAEIGFSAPYAADQHEQVAYSHPRGGRSKYLESVIVDEQGNLQAKLVDGILQAMAGGDDA